MKPYFSFQWHITDRCDQRCKHCYIFSDNQEHLNEMSLENLKDSLEKCIEFCKKHNRTPYFFITGGDPLLHPKFWEFLELLKKDNIGFSILGNPFHLDPNICKKLKEYGCEDYQLSIDGLEKTHDWFRKPGSFKETLSVIPYLKDANIEVNIMTTVSNINKEELLDIMDCVVDHNVDLFAFGRYCPGNSDEDNGLDPLEYRELLDKCYKKSIEYKDKNTFFAQKDHLWTLYNFEEGLFKIPENVQEGIIYSGCNCGNSHLTLLPNGDIYACRRVKNSKVGNILTDSLDKVWFENMESYREFTAFKKCSKCELLSWCRGCPAVASAKEDGFYSEDPQCWKEI